MNPMNLKNKRNALIAVGMLATLSGGVAQATSIQRSGALAHNWSGRHTLTIEDTRAEGDNAYANWNGSSANRVTTSGGLGATNAVTVASLDSFRACIDQGSWNPDECTDYTNP
jgi:hypothetical protein